MNETFGSQASLKTLIKKAHDFEKNSNGRKILNGAMFLKKATLFVHFIIVYKRNFKGEQASALKQNVY